MKGKPAEEVRKELKAGGKTDDVGEFEAEHGSPETRIRRRPPRREPTSGERAQMNARGPVGKNKEAHKAPVPFFRPKTAFALPG